MTQTSKKQMHILNIAEQMQIQLSELTEQLRLKLSEIENDCICGSWIGVNGNYSLTIRKSGGVYAAMLCDNTHFFKVILRELIVAATEVDLTIAGSESDTCDTVIYYPKRCRLRFGLYGLFETEEAVLQRSIPYEEFNPNTSDYDF